MKSMIADRIWHENEVEMSWCEHGPHVKKRRLDRDNVANSSQSGTSCTIEYPVPNIQTDFAYNFSASTNTHGNVFQQSTVTVACANVLGDSWSRNSPPWDSHYLHTAKPLPATNNAASAQIWSSGIRLNDGLDNFAEREGINTLSGSENNEDVRKEEEKYELGSSAFTSANSPTTYHTSANADNENVCYGMLSGVGTEDISICLELEDRLPVQWDQSIYLQDTWDASNVVRLSGRTHEMLSVLAEHARAIFEFWIHNDPLEKRVGPSAWSKTSCEKTKQLNSLSVIIYGPIDMATIVGDWLNDAKLFLQLPIECLLDVKYKNPHCLSFDDDPSITTGKLGLTGGGSRVPGRHLPQESLTDLYIEEAYDEAQQPVKISTTLHTHQKVALTFLLEREKSWNFEGQKTGLWRRHDDSFGVTKYKNVLSRQVQECALNDFRGGILADEMGLGKTCTMLSLIATDQANEAERLVGHRITRDIYPGTLIVVPFALLQVWEKQIRLHFQPNSVTWKIYHGCGRQSDLTSLGSYDIVITTYNMVALEWKHYKSQSGRINSQIFSAAWHRLVLDEAHVIRNRGTANAKAVWALRSERRWCITGTPIQNRLSDLYGLLRFLGVEPYNRFKNFENDILRPWRSHNDRTALTRLLQLMKAIAIRRPRSIIPLQPKTECIEIVDFSKNERSEYESAKEGAISIIDAATLDSSNSRSNYMNALQRINEMRYICNHGVSPRQKKSAPNFTSQESDEGSEFLVEEFDNLMDVNSINCVQCGTDIQEDNETHQQMLTAPAEHSPDLAGADIKQLCNDCRQQLFNSSSGLNTPSRLTDTGSPHTPDPATRHRSSKITALITQLRAIPPSEKSVIFSYWTSTLSAIATTLTETATTFIQYDGTLSRTQREQTLRDFDTDPSIRVILVSITCGGQGLDLTAANNAFLLEPQWNPMLEEQAMSRVHRMNQTKPVRLVRFIVRGTWEEKIRVLQERKRNLVDLIVDRRGLKDGDEGRKQLWFLKELIA